MGRIECYHKGKKCRYKDARCRRSFRIILLIKPNTTDTSLEHFNTIIYPPQSTRLLLSNITTLLNLLQMSFHPDNLPSLNGKVFIVTGGNAGM